MGGAKIHVNDTAVSAAPDSLGFVEIRNTWKVGDLVDLDLPMPVQRLEANPLVEETLNQVAIRRGPLIYCLESVDLPAGVHVLDTRLSDDTDLIARYDGHLLGGCVVIEGQAAKRSPPKWDGTLYRPIPVTPGDPTPLPLCLIPYALWGNREKGEMSVWLPRAHR